MEEVQPQSLWQMDLMEEEEQELEVQQVLKGEGEEAGR